MERAFAVVPDGWFDAQQSVVRRLATALNVHISAERIAAIAVQPVRDLRAYDLWLEATRCFSIFHRTNGTKQKIFRKIIAEIPAFGPAYSSPANAQNIIHLATREFFVNWRGQSRPSILHAKPFVLIQSTPARSFVSGGRA